MMRRSLVLLGCLVVGLSADPAPVSADAADPGFWDKGLSVISGMIDELEKM